jgi:hypothetical protein
MKLTILENSANYTGVVIRMRHKETLAGLDNLMGVTVFGNLTLVQKDYELEQLYVFFPAGTVLDQDFVSKNNLFREPTLNADQTKKGYFEPNARVKAIKFRGNTSTGVLMKLDCLAAIGIDTSSLKEGDEFNEIDGLLLCEKYVVPTKSANLASKQNKLLDKIVESKFFPEHPSTSFLLKHLHTLDLSDHVVLTYKLHGTSVRVGNTLTKRNLTWKDKIAKFFGVEVKTEHYQVVVGSHHVVKSVNFEGLKGKQHFYPTDLWTVAAKEFLAGKLYEGEIVYGELVGRMYPEGDQLGKEIQKDYTYGYAKPHLFVYRISNMNSQGVETDLSFKQVRARCNQLGVDFVPLIYDGRLEHYMLQQDLVVGENWKEVLEKHLVETYLDKPAKMDSNIVEEGICLRKESYPKPTILKLKSPEFYLHEGVELDKGIENVEDQN